MQSIDLGRERGNLEAAAASEPTSSAAINNDQATHRARRVDCTPVESNENCLAVWMKTTELRPMGAWCLADSDLARRRGCE